MTLRRPLPLIPIIRSLPLPKWGHPELTVPAPCNAPIVAAALALGIPLTVNSDAHAPDEVGTAFPEMETMLRELGCRTLANCEAGQRTSYHL